MSAASRSHARWRLTKFQVEEILRIAQAKANLARQLRELPTIRQLARQLGVADSTIIRIQAGQNKSPPPPGNSV